MKAPKARPSRIRWRSPGRIVAGAGTRSVRPAEAGSIATAENLYAAPGEGRNQTSELADFADGTRGENEQRASHRKRGAESQPVICPRERL